MLSIGRALMTHPALIVLDEATEGLAPLIVAEIWRVIGEIRASGIATLIVDRDYRKVLARADHALVLQKGQVVLQGTADEVASDPEYTPKMVETAEERVNLVYPAKLNLAKAWDLGLIPGVAVDVRVKPRGK